MSKKTLLEPEAMDINVWYTITINLSPNINYQSILDSGTKQRKNERSMFDIISTERAMIMELLNGQYKTRYVLFPELSRTGRLHWHGMIRFTKPEHIGIFYMHKLPRIMKVANVEIDIIEDMEKWKTYCMKGNKYMEPMLKELRINDNIYPLTNCNVEITLPLKV